MQYQEYALADYPSQTGVTMLSFFDRTCGDAIAARLAGVELVGRYIIDDRYESTYYANFEDDLSTVIMQRNYDYASLIQNVDIVKYHNHSFRYNADYTRIVRVNNDDKKIIRLCRQQNIPCVIIDCFGALQRNDAHVVELVTAFESFAANTGYHVQTFALDTCNYGVPQHRPRTVFLLTDSTENLVIPTEQQVLFGTIKDTDNNEEVVAHADADLVLVDNQIAPLGPNQTNHDLKAIRDADKKLLSLTEWRRLVTYPTDFLIEKNGEDNDEKIFYFNSLPPIYSANIISAVKARYL